MPKIIGVGELVRNALQQGLSVRKTSSFLGISRKTVKKFSSPQTISVTEKKKRFTQNERILLAAIEENNELYCKELRDIIFQKGGDWLDVSTVWRMTRRLGYYSQAILYKAAEQFSETAMERQYKYMFAEIPVYLPCQIFFMDETGIEFRQFQRIKGLGQKGMRPSRKGRYIKTKRANVLSCIGINGLISYRVTDSTTTTESFADFIIESVIPNIPKGSCIVWDNASFHQSLNLQAILEINGIQAIFLPPYSPDLNPIEISYAYVKQKVKSLFVSHSYEDLVVKIGLAFESIEPRHTYAWYERCGYINSKIF